MNAIFTIAVKEFQDGLRNRWVAASILLLGGLALVLAAVGSAPVGTVKGSMLATTVASLASLSVYLVPLIALMLTHDAIVGENERGTLLLLLSYPVTRGEILAGKFLGHLAILALAVTVGYGAAGAVLAVTTGAATADILAMVKLIATSVLLGAVFLALGYAISASVRERSTAIGAAFALWLGLVVLYDLALVGLLLADTDQTMGPSLFSTLMLLNPADAFRLLNVSALGAGLTGLESVAAFEVFGWLGTVSLTVWLMLSGGLAFMLLRRYEL